MKSPERQIARLFDTDPSGFTNRQDVILAALYDDIQSLAVSNIHISCIYPGYTEDDYNISLELFANYPTITDFIKEFSLCSARDVNKISPKQLLDLFHQGKASVYCCYGRRYLCYRKKGDKMLAGDFFEEGQELDRILEQPADFIRYTHSFLSIHLGRREY